MKNLSLLLLFFSCVLRAAGNVPDAPVALQAAVDNLYQSDFDAGRQALTEYSAAHPQDPLPYALKAASFLFAEMERGGALKGNLFADDRNVQKGASSKPDPQSEAALRESAALARKYAEARLSTNPKDHDALLALCILNGVERDYLALIAHRLRESYPFMKEANLYADRLLEADPTAYDAYLTKGFTEYLVASLPFYLRWMMNADSLTGSREQGLKDLQRAAESGHYLRPFAQLLLAMFYLRENRVEKTQELLAELTQQYPKNKTFRAEYEKLKARREAVHKTE